MANTVHKLQMMFIALVLGIATAAAQNIRYVKTDGDNAKDGASWATAKKDIQDAINDLVNNNLTGEVWVAAGKYYPTESTESSSNPLYKSFKIPAGITVRGGFKTGLTKADDGKNTETERPLQNDKNFGTAGANSGNLDGEGAKSGVYANKTILCGDLTSKPHSFTWNSTKQQFNTTFYGNAYHVVWFAMNGFNATTGRANPLTKAAKLEGCVIQGGHAYNSDATAAHPSNAYGGGIYMVANSFVYNCEVKNCDASRNGGGIYMDGGGIVRRTYVHDCQALGLGTEFGLGGGICEDGAAHNSKSNPIVVAQSAVTNCVGRMGGGMALVADKTDGKAKYSVVANSTLVNNNTAQVEGGGVYTYKGGGLASLTVVRNKCVGSGIMQNEVVTGRSGGVYNRDAAYIGNNVMWGNECPANNDVQYASSRTNLTDSEKTRFYYNAVSKMDETDWSGSTRMGVLSLDDNNNTDDKKGTKGYPLFFNPTPTAGYIADIDHDFGGTDPLKKYYNWTVSSESFLSYAGIATADLDNEGLTPAPTGKSWDMQFGEYNARPTIGAYISQVADIAPATNVIYNDVTYDYAFFVDPEFVYAGDNEGTNGASWNQPIRFLGNALDFIAENGIAGGGALRSMPSYNFGASGTKVAIFVKEGTVDNTRTWGESRIRVTSLDIPGNVSIFGSFGSKLAGTTVEKPNVVRTPSVISAKLMDSYDYNVAHLINIKDKQDINIEGFKITYANASSKALSNNNVDGAAITVQNSTNVKFKNIIVSNCTADHGAAVYADKSTVDFENCIFHNNTTKTINNSGLVYATNGSTLTFDHCDVLRNVGHASYLGSNGTTNRWTNTIFYGNMDRTMPDTNEDMGGGISHALAAFSGNTANATGNHCMFDSKSVNFRTQFGGATQNSEGKYVGDTGNKWQYDLQYRFQEGAGQGYPRFINPTKNAGVTQDGDQTYYGRATSFEPHNNNPVVNVASDASVGTDIIAITRNYGGLPDIGAVENHEADKKIEGENAYTDGQKKYGEVLYVRDYNTYNADGTLKTSDTDIANRDGSSWERAINGNGDYSLSGTHKYKTTSSGSEDIFKGFEIHFGDVYLAAGNGALHRVDKSTSTYTPDPSDPEAPEAWDPAYSGVFVLCGADGNPLGISADKTTAKYIKDASTGLYVYLDYMYGTYSFRTSVNPPLGQAEVIVAGNDGDGYTLQFSAHDTQRYLSNNSAMPSTTSTAWTFTTVNEHHDYKTGDVALEAYNMGTFKGLQYAVNLANIKYNDDVLDGKDPQAAKKQVWVGAGIYKRDPQVNSSSNTTGFKSAGVEMDNENCFIIQDGVDVYGAFPKTGNPGKDQRQALVSQYVYVLPERGINVSDYETILEPYTATGVVSGTRHRVLGQPYKYNPDVGNNGQRGTPLYCGTDYIGVVWDGFTLRNGVWDSKGLTRPNRYGGAGAAIYRNVTLKNVVVTNNTTIFTGTNKSQDFRAGGIYIDGGTLDAGYVINNELSGWNASAKAKYGAAYGGGMYIYTGTVFNSVIAKNHIYAAYADGAGTFIETSNFFNNTIVNNHAEGTDRMAAGIAVWTDPKKAMGYLNIYNTISVNNEGYKGNPNGKQSDTGDNNVAIQNGGTIHLYNCITEVIPDGYQYYKFKAGSAAAATITYDAATSQVATSDDFANLFEDLGTYESNFKDLNLRLKSTGTMAINTGNEAPVIGGAVYNLIDYNDMDFAERIQDCNIDIGAYEFNGATAVRPEEIGNQAIYYVTPNGYGTTNANDPANAACAEKLQRVLDAAGRYKYLNPTMQVIVKVANSYDLLHPTNGDNPENFKYYATRTTDWTDQDVRVWSIIVPRGVEVWGGYTDVASNNTTASWSNSDNGFYARSGSVGNYVYTDRRNITKNPTYFDSYYLNKLEKTDANTYHVVTFSDRIFDKNGYAYTKNDFKEKSADQISTILTNGDASIYEELLDNDESHFAHMSEKIDGVSTGVNGNVINIGTQETPVYASNRAVIDGIFVSGGKADASTQSNNSAVNINSYGGAALVNDYAYVRNCILTDNTATNGGALALTDNALVSGCLIMNNVATNNGGGIYVFEEGTKLSNGTTIKSLQQDGDPTMDYQMAHILTSTIVRNTAQRGGGVWYNDKFGNARFNSVAIWQNVAPEQANVYGSINPEQPTDDETISEVFYPFSYSAIQDMRASGTNNLNLGGENHHGARFVNKVHDVQGSSGTDQTDMAEEGNDAATKYDEFGFYGLTEYSLLCSNGMPKKMYNQLKATIAISDKDILGTDRMPTDEDNLFVEIGARALEMLMPKKQLMLRLFVADPKYVDTKTAIRFMRLRNGATGGSKEEYYSQVGSSFAYPFNSLQNALDYVKRARNGKIITGVKQYDAQNLPFEILVGKGEYYPKQSLNSETQNVWAHTFAIPEGVTIMGGFNPQGGSGTYYGRYYQSKATVDGSTPGSIYDNVQLLSTVTSHVDPSTTEIGRGNYYGEETVLLPKIVGEDSDPSITFQQWNIQDIADRRAMADNNKNSIIEPWEFANQTIISGNAVNGETDGVYHIMTAVADEDAVGKMPKVKSTNSAFVGDGDIANETGYQWKEEGQQIRLNGLIVTGGNALTYLSTALDEYGKYIFYQGAGLQVDGNRYKNNSSNPAVFHNSAAYGVGYRDIPVSVTNCQFRNNKAGYGGAISTNGSLSLFGSSFEQNLAIAQTEKPEVGQTWTTNVNGTPQNVEKVMYPGQGGAILATRQLSAFNTLFANNEAQLADGEEETIRLVKHPTFRVPVEANASATLRAAGGAIMMGSAAEHHIVNCNFVRNKANAYPAVFTMNPTTKQNNDVDTHDYSQIINTVAWGNEVNPDMLAKFSDNTAYQTASKLMVNIGKKGRTQEYITTKTTDPAKFYNPEFTTGNVPSASDLAVADPDAGGDDSWQEAVWFCAYEDGVGFKPNNTNDLRDAITYSAGKFAPWMIKKANVIEGVKTYQNCNILIVADNIDVAGPNFGNPSVKAGFEGFMEGADWSPARFNRLTDNGNGWIKQSVEATSTDYVVTFHTSDGEGSGYQGAYSYTHFISDIVSGKFPEYKLWLAIGNEKYMEATSDAETENVTINGLSITRQKNYPRISPDPTIGVTKAYIDIGVYEYVKQPLLKPGSEVDILWVSTKEKPQNGPADGSTWDKPTSDLQRAIETLLSSRNGHKKEIRIMEGEYTPVTPKTVNGQKYNAFVVDTKSLNGTAIVPSTWEYSGHRENYYAQSLTIKGGYSEDIMYEYNPSQYKTVIRQNEAVDGVSTDKLIYIVDPTVRYYYNTPGGYTSHDDGATYPVSGTAESNSTRTMPIQIDGVTLINDKAEANVKGSAIYYPDYATTINEAHSISVGGTVKYYTDATHTTPSGNGGTVETDFPLIDGTGAETKQNPAKLLINKTQIVGSGKKVGDNKETASAVYIGQNGGSALIYNTVFHSNYGMPLDAWNTVNVNNTFGKNAGLVKLQDADDVTEKSQMHNSVMWENNGGNAQFEIPRVSVNGEGNVTITGSEPANFTYNSFTGGNTIYIKDTDQTVIDNNYNTGLVAKNTDIMNGPNFLDPDNADIEARSFDIKPSLRLLNKGKDTNISDATLTGDDGSGPNYGNYYTLVVSKKYDYSLVSNFDKDVLFRTRLNRPRIDVGAYEFQGKMYQILYVDPNKSHNDDATGRNWDESFGYGDLQSAMDLAAVYHLNNLTEEAYVFSKGASSTNKDLHTNETLTIRDGVTVYGSIMSNYTDWHEIKDPKNPSQNKYATIDAFITDMKNQREGVASNSASKTIVTGIKTSEFTSFNGGTNGTTPALVDGFVVTPVDKDHQPTAPVLDVTNKSENAVIVVRNVIVAGNDLSKATDTDVNVAQISNGLIYEVLMRDNKPKGNGAVLLVSNGTNNTKGYAVNVTVEGKTVGADGSQPVDGKSSATADDNVESATQIFKSITNSINSGDGANAAGGNAPYGAITNKHISGNFYNIADANLNYQLTETSKYIDMCETNNPLTTVAPNLAQFINYTTDRDILGNPRYMRNVSSLDKIDRGAFETWKVDKNFVCGKWYDSGSVLRGTNSGLDDAIAHHFYPHDGSVVYIMEGKSLVIDPLGTGDVKATPHNPGYMLLKEGANFYGNGRPATCAYVAVERKVRRDGSIVAVPYAMKYKQDVALVEAESDGTTLKLTPKQAQQVRAYSGDGRSDWKYVFSKNDTPCWTVVGDDDVTKACEGVFYKPYDGARENALFRFTGKGTSMTDYIYTEELDADKHIYSKSISLSENDDYEITTSTDGESVIVSSSSSSNKGVDFTDEKDMGWNCIGLPWLVSSYKPYEDTNNAAHGTTEDVMMQNPHELWLYFDGTQAPDGTNGSMGDGGYYSVNSWETGGDTWDKTNNNPWHVTAANQECIWVGEGIFVQTATLDGTESLKFYRPVAPATFSASSAKAVRYFFDGNSSTEAKVESAEGAKVVAAEYYTASGMHLKTNGNELDYNNLPIMPRGTVIIVRKHYSDGTVKSQKFTF